MAAFGVRCLGTASECGGKPPHSEGLRPSQHKTLRSHGDPLDCLGCIAEIECHGYVSTSDDENTPFVIGPRFHGPEVEGAERRGLTAQSEELAIEISHRRIFFPGEFRALECLLTVWIGSLTLPLEFLELITAATPYGIDQPRI